MYVYILVQVCVCVYVLTYRLVCFLCFICTEFYRAQQQLLLPLLLFLFDLATWSSTAPFLPSSICCSIALLCAMLHCNKAERQAIKCSAVQMPGAQFNQIRNIKNLSGRNTLCICMYSHICMCHCCIAMFDSSLLLMSHSFTQFLWSQQLLVVKSPEFC